VFCVFFKEILARMALFLSTYVNKVDQKGRVSVPAQFRAALVAQGAKEIVLFCSGRHKALEGFSLSHMEEVARRLDEGLDLFSDAQDDLSASVFGEALQLSFDGDGRIVLPGDLLAFIGVRDQAAFVGLGHKFQIWEPAALEARKAAARQRVKEKNLTIPKGGRHG